MSNVRAGILLVVAVGVAMGVFVGGVLLVCAARHVRRYDCLSVIVSAFCALGPLEATGYGGNTPPRGKGCVCVAAL